MSHEHDPSSSSLRLSPGLETPCQRSTTHPLAFRSVWQPSTIFDHSLLSRRCQPSPPYHSHSSQAKLAIANSSQCKSTEYSLRQGKSVPSTQANPATGRCPGRIHDNEIKRVEGNSWMRRRRVLHVTQDESSSIFPSRASVQIW